MSNDAGSERPSPGIEEVPWTLTPLAVLQLASAFSKVAEPQFAHHGVLPIQCVILHVCAGGMASTLTELTQIIPVDTASISRHVNTLVKKGLLQRRRLQRDRRVVRLSLTENGLRLMPNLDECLTEIDSLLLRGISQKDRKLLSSTIAKICANSERWSKAYTE